MDTFFAAQTSLVSLKNDHQNFRSSRSQMFFKIGILKNSPNFTGKHLRWSIFLIKFKKRLQHRCFPVKFVKFLRTLNLCVTFQRDDVYLLFQFLEFKAN